MKKKSTSYLRDIGSLKQEMLKKIAIDTSLVKIQKGLTEF